MSLVIEATAQSPARRANSSASVLRNGRSVSRSVSILTIAPRVAVGWPTRQSLAYAGNAQQEEAGAPAPPANREWCSVDAMGREPFRPASRTRRPGHCAWLRIRRCLRSAQTACDRCPCRRWHRGATACRAGAPEYCRPGHILRHTFSRRGGALRCRAHCAKSHLLSCVPLQRIPHCCSWPLGSGADDFLDAHRGLILTVAALAARIFAPALLECDNLGGA